MKKSNSPKRYVALLRGVNVGGNSTVSMKELKSCLEKQGFQNVGTYINSGNVMFSHGGTAAEMAKEVEKCIKRKFKLDVRVVVRSAKEVAAIVKKIPANWVNDGSMKTDVIFLFEEFDSRKVLSAIVQNPAVDRLVYTKGAVIWNIDRKDYGKSKMKYFIGTDVYKGSTARNVNTARKLVSLLV